MSEEVTTDHLTLREHRCLVFGLILIPFATVAWWFFLLISPSVRVASLGVEFAPHWRWILLPDALTCLACVYAAVALLRRHKSALSATWFAFGTQAYACAFSFSLAVTDPSASQGFVAMFLGSGLLAAIALRLQNIRVLWGPFSFKPANMSEGYWLRTLKQTGTMWFVFLVAVPSLIAGFEIAMGWHTNWIRSDVRLIPALALFALASALGIWSGRTMALEGEGTPLPSAHARKLVIHGPYAFLRNPMALSGILQAFAVGLAIGSPLTMSYALIGSTWWDLLARSQEEEHLLRIFGEDYNEFRKRVPCWVPRLSRFVADSNEQPRT